MKTSDILFCFDATFDFLRNLIWLLYGERCMGKIFKRFAVFYFIVFHCLYVFMPKKLQPDRKRTQSVFKVYSECRNSDERGRINSAQKQGQNHALMEKISFNRFLTAFENNGRWDVISAWTLSVNTIKMKELVHLLSHVNAFWLKVQKTNDLRIHFILANVYIIWSKFIGEVSDLTVQRFLSLMKFDSSIFYTKNLWSKHIM